MTYKSINSLKNNLKADLEGRYNIKCYFIEDSLPNKTRLVCRLTDDSVSKVREIWHFIYDFDPCYLIGAYNLILGEIMIGLEEKWMDRLYKK